MPVAVSYPGVYIEEIPSGVRTITGVATSIAAFIGWAAKGPTDHAELILSWSDFERQFGGLDVNSLLGYGVYQFFLNGGQQCYVIRLVGAGNAPATVTLADLVLSAANPGLWGNDYAITILARTDDPTRFRVAVVYKPGTPQEATVETFENLSMTSTDSRFVKLVINEDSTILAADTTGTTQPSDTGSPQPLTGGLDGTVLQPDTAGFETALVPGGGTGGVFLLDHVDLFNLLCVPGETTATVLASLEKYCHDHRAFLIADCDSDASFSSVQGGPPTQLTGVDGLNAAFYFPWLNAPDPMQENRLRAFPPCGFIAGIYARTDSSRGVWKAPAGTEASVTGAASVVVPLTDKENGVLNPQAINCVRNFPVYGIVAWGARTLNGNDQIGSEWKYIPVRRMALFLEESLYRGTKWVVFEPNDEPLWAQIRLNLGAFMQGLFRQGAFQGKTPQEAYFVKCDKETTTQNDINLGIVNILVGFAPLKPAEFVIIQIQQMAGQIAT
ncbi:MAG TPA: phage tail sheath C-terminal domain-containing protein [Opitutaceae bacterium]|nr:phage tail sheath C-terminal domain-containing protein [Opitutaceae bacterium]